MRVMYIFIVFFNFIYVEDLDKYIIAYINYENEPWADKYGFYLYRENGKPFIKSSPNFEFESHLKPGCNVSNMSNKDSTFVVAAGKNSQNVAPQCQWVLEDTNKHVNHNDKMYPNVHL